MTTLTLTIKHKTQLGKREQVRIIWERHMAPAIASNPGHTAYLKDDEPLLAGPPQVTALTPMWSKVS
jgi:hypothetical protein